MQRGLFVCCIYRTEQRGHCIYTSRSLRSERLAPIVYSSRVYCIYRRLWGSTVGTVDTIGSCPHSWAVLPLWLTVGFGGLKGGEIAQKMGELWQKCGEFFRNSGRFCLKTVAFL